MMLYIYNFEKAISSFGAEWLRDEPKERLWEILTSRGPKILSVFNLSTEKLTGV